MGSRGSPATATTRPPRWGPTRRHCRESSSRGSRVIALLRPQARVEGVAQAVAEEVQGQAGEGEGQARERAHPERLAEDVLAAGDHVAPPGHGGGSGAAEEA